MIADLGLIVVFWIVGGGKSIGDLLLGTKVCYFPSREIDLVVGNDGMRKFKVTHDVLP